MISPSFHLALLLPLLSILVPRAATSRPACPSATLLAVGSYTSQPWLPTSAGDGVSLFQYSSDQLQLFATLPPSVVSTNPSYLAIDSSYIYAANENPNATVTRLPSFGSRPPESSISTATNASAATHIAKFSSRIVAVANFEGAVSTLLSNDHGLTLLDTYHVPPSFASALRTPSLSDSYWQFESPHPHMVLPYRNGLLVPDLGSDMVLFFNVARQTGKLSLQANVTFEPADGPRHAALHQQSSTVYVVNEISLSVVTLRYGVCGPRLSICDRHDLFPYSVGEDVSAAAIRVTEDGRFLYVSVRFPDTQLGRIVGYRLDARTGDIQARIGIWSSFGVHPRDFYVVENVLYREACVSFVAIVNRDTDNMVLVKRDRGSGMLTSYVSMSANVTTPTSVLQF